MKQVVLIQVTSPALSESPKLEVKVSELIARINGTYGSLEFTPVHHYHNDIDQDEYYSLMSVADIGLITSVRDGMNTTSLEYIVCQKDNHGPLILSEFTGTAGSLSAAMMVNPWDYKGVAGAIYDALNLSKEEKKNKHVVCVFIFYIKDDCDKYIYKLTTIYITIYCSCYIILSHHIQPSSGLSLSLKNFSQILIR